MKALVLTSEIIMLIRWVITGLTTAFFAYQIAVAFFGFLPMKKPNKKTDKLHSFAVVISARNEAGVIGYLLDSLQGQRYPAESYDIFVIADNCTDNTAEFARAKGAVVYQRHNKEKMSKGFALGWMFDILMRDYRDRYDAVCVFDADNIVHPDFLLHMNQQLCAGVEIAQGYRDIKNPSDSWISGNYALYFWTNIRFYQIPRYNMGLSCMVGGTGFMFKTDVLLTESGWNTATICEDVEFSLHKISEGYKIGFAYDAKFYDEQPVTFRQSWTQRMRWTAGNIMCINQCMPGLLRGGIRPFQSFDSVMFLFAIPSIIGGLLATVLDIIARLLNITTLPAAIPSIIAFAALSYLVTFAQGLIVVLAERKPIKTVWKGLLTYPIFMVSWALVSFWGTLRQETKWKPIAHSKAISLEELRQEKKREKNYL